MQHKGGVRVARKILVVDDDVNMRSVLEYRLEKDGHSVLLAGDGAHALELVRKERPDLVILDLVLPRLDGFGFLEALRGVEETISLPVLVLTAYGHEQNRIRSFELGAVCFVVKPFSPRTVAADVKRLLAAGRQAPPT
jgi:two-component system alkaline phosphatase synthesis response regulator PhoP